jgi:GDPmannose 4,6-dehydratase
MRQVDLLVGDSSKAKQKLDWEAKINLRDLVMLMVDNDLRLENSEK